MCEICEQQNKSLIDKVVEDWNDIGGLVDFTSKHILVDRHVLDADKPATNLRTRFHILDAKQNVIHRFRGKKAAMVKLHE